MCLRPATGHDILAWVQGVWSLSGRSKRGVTMSTRISVSVIIIITGFLMTGCPNDTSNYKYIEVLEWFFKSGNNDVYVRVKIPYDILYKIKDGKYQYDISVFKLIARDGSTALAELQGVKGGPPLKMDRPIVEYYLSSKQPPNSKVQDLLIYFIVGTDQLNAGGLKFQCRDSPPIELTLNKHKGSMDHNNYKY